MKRIFQRVPPFDPRTTVQHRQRLPKIGMMGGCILVFLLFLKPGFPQALNNFKPASEPDGFGKIYWGIDIITLGNMEYSRKDPSYGGIDVYRKTGDRPRICGVAAKHIEYLFWKGRFCGIIFFEEGFSGYDPFRDAVFKEFGQGSKPFPDQEYYVWEGKKTFMTLEYDPVGKKLLFWMFGITILRQMEQSTK